MDRRQCLICGWYQNDKLCEKHSERYLWDSSAKGYRLKKRYRGSRYTNEDYHKREIALTKAIESYYGQSDVVTSYHPLWAESTKGVLLEYDILIKSKNILIEYNGIQHYKRSAFFHKTKLKFKSQVKRDKKKIKLAKRNDYILITFKYDEPVVKDYVIRKIESLDIKK